MTQSNRLELQWVGKDDHPKIEPRILLDVPEFAYHSKHRRPSDVFDNLLIQGDNLLGLKEPDKAV